MHTILKNKKRGQKKLDQFIFIYFLVFFSIFKVILQHWSSLTPL